MLGYRDPFELGVRAILFQQITVKGATTLAGRIAKLFGQPLSADNRVTHLFPTPEALARANFAPVGLPKARAESIRALALAVCRREICFDGVVDSDEFCSRLLKIPGIGRWTAQYIAMRALGDPDAFPSGDIALRHGSGVATNRELGLRE